MRKLSFLLLLILLLGLAGQTSGRAQNGMRVTLYGLQTASFPAISVRMDVYDAAGNFIAGLTPADVTVLEDGVPRPLDRLEKLQPGARFAVAINTGAAFARRDAYAVTRLDVIRRSLLDWASALPADNADDLILVANGAADWPRRDAAGFREAVAAYQPDPRTLLPTLDILSRALDRAAVSDPLSGQKSAVLFVSSLPDPAQFAALQSLAARAVQLKIRVHVWIVADQSQFTIAGATALKDLAIQTGGQYTLFSGTEPLPSPEAYLVPLRHTYALAYTSGLASSGSHTITVTVNAGGQTAAAEPLSFDLNVQPPNPILVSPPSQILRRPPDEATSNLMAFVPSSQVIEMLVEFPDGHPRPLVRTALYVDGQKVAENTAAPFDKFSWDVSAYTTSGEHYLQVEAEDSLGLSRVSLAVPVTVTVLQPPGGLAQTLKRNAGWIAGGAVLLAGAVLTLVLAGGVQRRRANREAGRRSRSDPLTQPVEAAGGKRSQRLARRVKPSPAYLLRLRADGQAITAPPIPLSGEEVIFGSDPTQATYVLNDPSVSPRHARLARQAEGAFILEDEGSAAGTWINFEPVAAPRRLQHGDVLHIGQVSYRFLLRAPPERPGPRLIPERK